MLNLIFAGFYIRKTFSFILSQSKSPVFYKQIVPGKIELMSEMFISLLKMKTFNDKKFQKSTTE